MTEQQTEEQARREGWTYLVGYLPCPAEVGQNECGECNNKTTEYCGNEAILEMTWVDNSWLPVASCSSCTAMLSIDEFSDLVHTIEWVRPTKV